MPNHVKNILRFDGNGVDVFSFLDKISEDGKEIGMIDFNKVIPMPESLKLESGSNTQLSIEAVLKALEHDSCYWTSKKFSSTSDADFSIRVEHSGKSKQELLDLGLQYIANKVHYGHTTWYGWCCEHWGTKWNAYDRSCEGKEISFHTAWSAPHPVIEKIAEMFPDVSIVHKWADEDIGSNCGYRMYVGGKLIEQYFPVDNREAIEFACGLWGYDADEYIDELLAEGNEVS